MQTIITVQMTPDEFVEYIRRGVAEALDARKDVAGNIGDNAPFTRKQAADYLGVSMPTLDGLIKSGQIESFNIGRNIVRIRRNSVEAYVAKSR